MTFIYALMAGKLVLYVGHTKNLKQRRSQHKCKSSGTGSVDIPDYMEWDIVLLEECEHEGRIKREAYWYDILMPFYNLVRPGSMTEAWWRQKTEMRERNMKKFLEERAKKKLNGGGGGLAGIPQNHTEQNEPRADDDGEPEEGG